MSVEDTLKERGKRYGEFINNASTAQMIKFAMRGGQGWGGLTVDQVEALEVIAQKIARIINGDATYADNWHDIAGYAQLVENRLLGK